MHIRVYIAKTYLPSWFCCAPFLCLATLNTRVIIVLIINAHAGGNTPRLHAAALASESEFKSVFQKQTKNNQNTNLRNCLQSEINQNK